MAGRLGMKYAFRSASVDVNNSSTSANSGAGHQHQRLSLSSNNSSNNSLNNSFLLTLPKKTPEMSFSMFKENFTSGFSSIRRRLSSSDIPSDVIDEQQQQPQQPTGQAYQQPVQQPQQPQQQQQQPVQQQRPTALPTAAQPVGKMSSAPTSPQQTAVPSFARGLFSAASNYVTAAVSSATTGKDSKGKIILVVDEDSTDWSKYFRGKKINDIDVRLEQAEFRELHLVSMPRGEVVVEIHAQRGGQTVQRYIKPDLVLVRQHVLNDQPGRLSNDDNRRIVVGLDTSGMPAVNSLASVYNFADRGWVIECPPTYKGPVVIKTGNGHIGLGKMKLEAGLDIREIAHLLMGSTTGGQSYLTVEPFIDARSDIYIIKIGAAYKVYSRRSAQGHWKATVGPAHMELIALNERYKFWADQCAELFGGLDVVAISVMQAKDGREFIVEVKDSTMQLSSEGIHEDERRLMADLCVSKLSYFSRDAAVRANSQLSNAPPAGMSQSTPGSAPLQKQSSMSAVPTEPRAAPQHQQTSQHASPANRPAPPQQAPPPQPTPPPQQPPPPQQQQQQKEPPHSHSHSHSGPHAHSHGPPPPPQPAPPPQQPPAPRPQAPPSQPPPPLAQQQAPAPHHPPPPPQVQAPVPTPAPSNPFLADLAPKPAAPAPTQPPVPQPPIVPIQAPRFDGPGVQRQPSLQQGGAGGPPPVPGPPSQQRAPPPLPPPATRQMSIGGSGSAPQRPGPPLPPPPAGPQASPQHQPAPVAAAPPPGQPPAAAAAAAPPVPPAPGAAGGQPVAGRIGHALTNKSQSLMEDTEDTMKNLKKTFAGIFGEM